MVCPCQTALSSGQGDLNHLRNKYPSEVNPHLCKGDMLRKAMSTKMALSFFQTLFIKMYMTDP